LRGDGTLVLLLGQHGRCHERLANLRQLVKRLLVAALDVGLRYVLGHRGECCRFLSLLAILRDQL